MSGRQIRLAISRLLDRAACTVRPPSPCQVRGWCNSSLCNGESCPTCGTWDRPTGPYRQRA